MSWPVDAGKLERFRALMAEQELDAVVVRSPDNIVYLDSYWGMKGYDALVMPASGDPVLVVLEPQLEEAARTSWSTDLRPLDGYHASDPRPPWFRTIDICREVLRERGLTGRVGLELTQGTAAGDLMVAEPTVFSQTWFGGFDDVCREVVDASGLLAQARAIKTEQEIERMRLAADLAADAMEHVRDAIRPGMKTSEVGALYESYVHSNGTGYRGLVDHARAFTLVWSGPGIRTFTATSDRPCASTSRRCSRSGWCTDGYWCDLTKNACPGELTRRVRRARPTGCSAYTGARSTICGPGRASRARPAGARGDRCARLSRAAVSPDAHGVGARAHEPPFAHQAGAARSRREWCSPVEPGLYWPGGGGLRVEDNFLITESGCEMLGRYPDDFRTA